MARFLDGPAEGVELLLRSCPTLLRLVQDQASGKWDALDQPTDDPEPNETVSVYQLRPDSWNAMFIRPGGRYEYGDYRHVPEAPTEQLRLRMEWVSWARAYGREHGLWADDNPPSPEESDAIQ